MVGARSAGRTAAHSGLCGRVASERAGSRSRPRDPGGWREGSALTNILWARRAAALPPSPPPGTRTAARARAAPSWPTPPTSARACASRRRGSRASATARSRPTRGWRPRPRPRSRRRTARGWRRGTPPRSATPPSPRRTAASASSTGWRVRRGAAACAPYGATPAWAPACARRARSARYHHHAARSCPPRTLCRRTARALRPAGRGGHARVGARGGAQQRQGGAAPSAAHCRAAGRGARAAGEAEEVVRGCVVVVVALRQQRAAAAVRAGCGPLAPCSNSAMKPTCQ